MNWNYPNISNGPPAEQLKEIRSFLFQLIEQLNMEAAGVTRKEQSAARGAQSAAGTADTIPEQIQSPKSTFNQIKSLIIKSAEIVDAYYTQISRRLEGVYVAESAFGEYRQETTQSILETGERIDRAFENLQTITGQLEQVIKVNANIRTGLLYFVGAEGELLAPELPAGTPVYGVEVGQTTTVDGAEVFNKFARFTAYGMVFYDENGNISAYISDSKLRIPNALIEASLTRGGFVETIGSDGGSVERWVGV